MDKMDKKKESERRRLTLSAAELAEAGIAFLCGVCPLSPLVSPFGLAYLFSKTKLTLPLAAGLVLSLPFSPQPLVYALLYLLGFALLWLSAGRKLPAAARAALCVAFSAVLALTASPFSGADGFVAALFAFVAVPGFAYLFPCAAAAKQPGGCSAAGWRSPTSRCGRCRCLRFPFSGRNCCWPSSLRWRRA